MSKHIALAVLVLATAALLKGQDQPRSVTVFTHATVIPMDSDGEVPDATVFVEGGRITQVVPSKTAVIPKNAQVVDCRGKFLIPGLADMHMHVDRKEMLPLFLSEGVTTTLNMGLASPQFVTQTRYDLRTGKAVGPQVFVAFLIDGPGDPGPEYVPQSEQDAREAVDRARLIGYDFIKAYSRLQPNIYGTIADESRRQHLALIGHIPTAVGLEKSLAAGQVMIAHGEEFYKTYFDNKPDESRIAGAVELTRQAGAYVTPNLSFFSALTKRTADPFEADRELASEEGRYIPPDLRGGWMRRTDKGSDRFIAEYHLIQKLTLALSKAGVPLLTGTDSPAPGMVPGFSEHKDLEELVAAGLTPYQALAAATRTPGEFIHRYVPDAERFGTIAAGERADLVLLGADPLTDIRNTRLIVGVMTGGRWFESSELRAMIEKPVPRYRSVTGMEERFQNRLVEAGAETAIREFKSRPNSGDTLPESFLNSIGYRLISEKNLPGAIAIFKLNTELYPDSWNVYDSLGEAYADASQRDLAILNYRHSLAINPHNVGAERVLQGVIGNQR